MQQQKIETREFLSRSNPESFYIEFYFFVEEAFKLQKYSRNIVKIEHFHAQHLNTHHPMLILDFSFRCSLGQTMDISYNSLHSPVLS